MDFHSLIDDFDKIFSTEKLIADLFFSNKCNLKCLHCYFGYTKNISTPLPYNTWLRIINDLHKNGVRHFHLSGKESSLEADSVELVKYIKSKQNTFCGIVSNGTGHLDYYQSLISNNIDYIEFSIDGLEENHNYLRGDNIFHDNVKAIENACHIKQQIINISTTLNRLNHNYFLQLVNYFDQVGVKRFFATPFIEKGNGANIKSLSINGDDFALLIEKTFDFINNTSSKGLVIKYCIQHEHILPSLNKSKFIQEIVKGYFSKKNDLIFRINGNTIQLSFNFIEFDYLSQLIVTNDGYILPCADDISYTKYSEISLGNLNQSTIDKILAKRKDSLKYQINNSIKFQKLWKEKMKKEEWKTS